MKITNEDNMKLMSRYEDNHFDIAIVDPPYGIGISSNPVRQKHNKKKWDDNIPQKEYFDELFRVSKDQIIWGGNYFDLPPTQGFFIWDKKQPHDFSLAMCEYAWSSLQKPAKMWSLSVLKEKGKIHPTQKPVELYEWILLNNAQKKCDHKHGEQDRSICSDCRNSDVKILDTHLGSGSIAIACHNLGFDLTACELDEEYFNAAIKRIEQHKAQQRLF